MDYTDLATVKTLMGISGSAKDTQITLLIPMVTATINKALDRDLRWTAYVEKQDGSGTELLRLEQWAVDIAETFQVKVGDAVIASDNYEIDAEAALVTRKSTTNLQLWRTLPVWEIGVQNIEITYTAGYKFGGSPALPPDVTQAASYAVGYFLENSGAIAGGFESERIGHYSYKRAAPGSVSDAGSAGGLALPAQVWGMLAPYKREEFSAARKD